MVLGVPLVNTTRALAVRVRLRATTCLLQGRVCTTRAALDLTRWVLQHLARCVLLVRHRLQHLRRALHAVWELSTR